MAPARGDHAAQLDRPLRGREGQVPLRRAGHRLRGVHHPARHAVRRHLLRHGARAPRRAAPERLARGGRLRAPHHRRVGRGARGRGQGEDRRPAGRDRDQPGQRRADSRVRGRLRADGVRHRRHHGRARPRRARLRVRRQVRPGDPAGGRWRRRRAALHRRRAADQLGPLRRQRQPRGAGRDHRVAGRRGPRRARRELPPARLAALAPALLGLPDPGRALPRVRHRRRARRPAARRAARRRRLQAQGPLAAGGGRGLGEHRLPVLRRPRQARDRHDGHLRRLVLVLPALLRRAQRPGAVGPRRRWTAGWPWTSTSAA